jgi:tetratricopeptide (TPR) repeat protein
MALVVGAAPLASLVLAGCSVALLMLIHPLNKSSDSIWHYPFPFLVGWTLPCLLSLPGILLPDHYEYAGRKMETDAMHLLTILRMTDAEMAKKISDAQTRLSISDEIDPSTLSLEEAVTRADAAPDNPLALSTAAHFLRGANDPRALVYLEKLVNLNLAPAKRIYFLDLYLTCALEINAVSLHPEEMEKLSRELVASDPDNISKRGTLGSILVDLGRIEEGKALLHEVLIKTTSTIDKTYSYVFLALAAKQEGNLELARDHAQKAVGINSASPALKRVSDLLSPPAQEGKE